jgi:hypothetical protein
MATREEMDRAAEQARKEFEKLMGDSKTTALDLVRFHQKWFMTAGHKRLGQMYRSFGS